MNNMTTKLVNVRLPEELLARATTIVKKEGYSSIQELMKESLRNHIDQRLKEQALIALKQMVGSQKGRKEISKAEMDKYLQKNFFIVNK